MSDPNFHFLIYRNQMQIGQKHYYTLEFRIKWIQDALWELHGDSEFIFTCCPRSQEDRSKMNLYISYSRHSILLNCPQRPSKNINPRRVVILIHIMCICFFPLYFLVLTRQPSFSIQMFSQWEVALCPVKEGGGGGRNAAGCLLWWLSNSVPIMADKTSIYL